MARCDLIKQMYTKEMSPLEFHFDALQILPMYNYITPMDVAELNSIAMSIKYASKIKLKYEMIDKVMRRRGFVKFHCGTNRIVYKHLEDTRFLVKIALDRVGIHDNPREYKNQFLLKPFVTKMFECSPCGTVAFVERVQPITSKVEFMSIADDVFDLITNFILGKYVVDDFGTKFFMNYGLRDGFGVVLLDSPYVYELDGRKMYCNLLINRITGEVCSGEIDYDAGFNKLQCTKCGKTYNPAELENTDSKGNDLIIIKNEEDFDMKVTLKIGGKVVVGRNNQNSTITNTPKVVKKRVRYGLSSINDKQVHELGFVAADKKKDKPLCSIIVNNKPLKKKKEFINYKGLDNLSIGNNKHFETKITVDGEKIAQTITEPRIIKRKNNNSQNKKHNNGKNNNNNRVDKFNNKYNKKEEVKPVIEEPKVEPIVEEVIVEQPIVETQPEEVVAVKEEVDTKVIKHQQVSKSIKTMSFDEIDSLY